MHITFISNLTRIFWRYYNFVPKRLKFFVATFINYALINAYIYFWGTVGSFKIGFIFGCISVFLYIFSVLFGLTKSNFFKSISVPAVFIISTFLILNYFPNLNLYFKLAFGVFSGLLYYFLLLSINVFFVVEEKGSSIPLLRPAKTTFLMLEVVTLFLFFTVLYKFILPDPLTEATLLFQALVAVIVGFLFATEYWWSQNIEKEILGFVGNESLTIGFVVGVVSLALSFFSTEAFFRSLALITAYYIVLSFIQSIVTHKATKNQYLEYAALVAIVFLFLLLA